MDTELNISGMEEADYLAGLLLKQLRQEITDAELQYLENWKASHPAHAQVGEQLNNDEQLLADLLEMKQVDMEGWWQKISAQAAIVSKPVPFYRRWYTYAAAAAVLLIAGAVTWKYWWPEKQTQAVTEKQQPANGPILPGSNKATLTLSNGSVINLVNAVNGTIAEESAVTIIKAQDGELQYKPAGDQPAGKSAELAMNILSTPRGGQYKLVLPDGSKAWLNAASSITYPARFSEGERRVTITGEVYFDVSSLPPDSYRDSPGRGGGKKTPFIVSVQSPTGHNLAQVEVVGTTFNVMAYDDEAAIKTTLLHGIVKVSVPQSVNQFSPPGQTGNYKLLTPGQQAQIAQHVSETAGIDSIKIINKADTRVAMSWKDGFWTYDNTDVRSIMRSLARWYDIEVDYEAIVPNYKFTGSISRATNLDSVVKMLQFNGVHLKLEQNKLVVLP